VEKIKVKYILYLGAFILLLIIGNFFNKKDEVIIISNNEITSNSGDKNIDYIYVHIVGEINEPGIKSIPKGSRLFELINMAGGSTENADLSKVNLASVLKDEQKVYIPAIVLQSEHNGSSIDNINYSSNFESLINLNSCSKEELKKLDGIGDSMAQRILDYREKNGYFSSIEEIKKISGIGDAKFDKIRENITV